MLNEGNQSELTMQRLMSQQDPWRQRAIDYMAEGKPGTPNAGGIDLSTSVLVELGINPERAHEGNYSGAVDWRFVD